MRHRTTRSALTTLLLGGGVAAALVTAPLAAAAPAQPDPARPDVVAQPGPPVPIDVTACADGICEVQVRQGTVIPLDPGTGVSELRVAALGQGRITLVAAGDRGGRSIVTTGEGGITLLNRLVIEVLRIDATTADLTLRPL